MLGNVEEWTQSQMVDGAGRPFQVACGGSYFTAAPENSIHGDIAGGYGSFLATSAIGFRVIRDP